MKNYLISHDPELLEGKATSSHGNVFSGKKKISEALGLGEKLQNLCKVLAATM